MESIKNNKEMKQAEVYDYIGNIYELILHVKFWNNFFMLLFAFFCKKNSGFCDELKVLKNRIYLK